MLDAKKKRSYPWFPNHELYMNIHEYNHEYPCTITMNIHDIFLHKMDHEYS